MQTQIKKIKITTNDDDNNSYSSRYMLQKGYEKINRIISVVYAVPSCPPASPSKKVLLPHPNPATLPNKHPFLPTQKLNCMQTRTKCEYTRE